jgi:hypothetical protein|tara:strand:- start:144 stop:455 length:312 start_codon:yes stop_codon:yes gene_type:complete
MCLTGLTEARKGAGLTQTQLAYICGWNQGVDLDKTSKSENRYIRREYIMPRHIRIAVKDESPEGIEYLIDHNLDEDCYWDGLIMGTCLGIILIELGVYAWLTL